MVTARKPDTFLEYGATPWLMLSAALTSVPHVEHLPLWLSLLAAGLVLWRTWIWKRNFRLPGRAFLTLLVFAGVSGIGWEYRTLFGRDAGVALLVLFMAMKPMEMKTRRDAIVLVMLGFFLLLTHFLYSQSIPTGVWLLAVTVLLISSLIRLHGGDQPIAEILKHTGSMLVQAAPVMLIAFFLFPRVSGPLWGLPQDAHSGLSGLSNQMSPGSLNNLIQSGAIAFRVQFAEEGADAVPEKSQLYWRGPVFDEYDGRTWRARLPLAQRPGKAPLIEATGKRYRYTLTIEPHNLRWLLALDLPIAIPAESLIAPTLETYAREPVRQRVRHEFVSSVDFMVNRNEAGAVLNQALRLPPGFNPRARELAEAWRAQFRSPEMISNAALLHFRQEAFVYTLQPPLLEENAVDDFLFETRSGFCEHFASAYVFLMRAAGVPARVVAGYQGGEINPVDGYMTVRQSDAHAWAEIWIAEKGWIRIDPTAAVAPSRIALGINAALPTEDLLPALVRLDNPVFRALRNRWEAANNAWNQWVLGYNPQRQREFLSRFGFGEPDWRAMTALMAVLSGLATLLIGLWMFVHRGRTSREVRLWMRFCEQMAQIGLARNAWEGPRDFAARVARERADLGPVTRKAAECFAEVRYGTGRSERLQDLKDCLRQLSSVRRTL